MILQPHFIRLHRCQLVLCIAIILLLYFPSISFTVTNFSIESVEKRLPSFFDFDDIWFYDDEMVKVIPEIDLEWVSVVFTSDLFIQDRAVDSGDSEPFHQVVKTIVFNHNDIIDSFYDKNLAIDACFFKLRENMTLNELISLIFKLDNDKFILYAHPVIRIKNKNYAFFNAFELVWKSGINTEVRDRIREQAHISMDSDRKIYRIDVFKIPFFAALRLLAEDIHVLKATPYLVELKPTIRAELSLPITGGNIGDMIPFELNISFSHVVSLDPSSIANLDITPAGIQKELFEIKIDPYDYVAASEKSPICITGWLKIYTPGEFTIPSIKIRYTCFACSDKKDRYIETKEIAFKVSSIVPSKQRENRLIIPEDCLSPDYKIESNHRKANISLAIGSMSFVMAFLIIAWLIIQLHKISAGKKNLNIKQKEEILREKIQSFLQEAPPKPHWVYLGEASKMMREFLVEKYRLKNYPAGGTGMIFFKTVKDLLPESLNPSIQYLLERIDDIVAREVETQPDISSINSMFKNIIDRP